MFSQPTKMIRNDSQNYSFLKITTQKDGYMLTSFFILEQFFQKLYTWLWLRVMESLMPEFQPYKDRIPEFIAKLYYILEQREFNEYLSWNGDSEIIIKQPKRLEDKVLPHFFRHRNLPSFIRQLNMYRFSKVVKLVKERNYMYFKNPHFRRGEIKELLKMTRNTKKSRRSNLEIEDCSDGAKSDNLSIDEELKKQSGGLQEYRAFVHQTVQEIADTLRRLESSHPQIKEDLKLSLTKCNQLLDYRSQQESHSYVNLSDSFSNMRLQKSQKFMGILDASAFFASQINF